MNHTKLSFCLQSNAGNSPNRHLTQPAADVVSATSSPVVADFNQPE